MNREFRLSPPASTRGTDGSSAVQASRINSAEDLQAMQLLRFWSKYKVTLDEPAAHGPVNWNAVLGIVLVGGVSAGFWAGVGWMVAAHLK